MAEHDSYSWLQELERKIDLLLNYFELDAAATQSMPESLRAIAALVNQGKKIEAIKLYRQQTGASLEEAKSLVERLDANSHIYQRVSRKLDLVLLKLEIPNTTRNASEDFYGEIKALLRDRNKIEAIRVYREATGLGLREAKAAVEAIENELG